MALPGGNIVERARALEVFLDAVAATPPRVEHGVDKRFEDLLTTKKKSAASQGAPAHGSRLRKDSVTGRGLGRRSASAGGCWARLRRERHEGSPDAQSSRLPIKRRRPPPQPVGDDHLAVARHRLDVLPHPPVEVVLVQLGADDGLMHLAQLPQGERLRQETVGVGVDVDVAVSDLVASLQRRRRQR